MELTVANFSHFNNSGHANSALGKRDTDKIQADRELGEVRQLFCRFDSVT